MVRKRKFFDLDLITRLRELGLTWTAIRNHPEINSSRDCLLRWREEVGFEDPKQKIPNDQVDNLVTNYSQGQPRRGEVTIAAHVATTGFYVPRQQLRDSIHRVDPDGVEERSRKPIKRKVYYSNGPHHDWHMDGNHKLIRWGMMPDEIKMDAGTMEKVIARGIFESSEDIAAVTGDTCTVATISSLQSDKSNHKSAPKSNLPKKKACTNISKVILLSDEKITQLIGRNKENLKFIEKICSVKINICGKKASESGEQIKVTLRSTKIEEGLTFDDLKWAENVYRFVKSATRGGFVKKLRKEDYESLANKKDGSILKENNLETLENQYNVEIKYFGFNELVYVCVLEKLGTTRLRQGLERSIVLVAEWIHARYRNDRCSVPLASDFKFRMSIPDDNKITRKEQKRRDRKCK
eukprot:gene23715-32095_t